MTEAQPTVTVMCATPDELAALLDVLPPCRRTTVPGCFEEIYVGDGCILMQPGIGKLNAALATTLACTVLRSSAIVFSGVAGSLDPRLSPGDMIFGTAFATVDYGLMADGRLHPVIYGELPIAPKGTLTATGVKTSFGERGHLQVMETARSAIAPDDPERIGLGEILSADYFLNCTTSRQGLLARFPEARAFDMESAAVTFVADRFHVPSFIIRTISDSADGSSDVDYVSVVAQTARNSAAAVPAFLKILQGG